MYHVIVNATNRTGRVMMVDKYLLKVSGTANNNKFYNMIDNGDDTFTAHYGRVGADGSKKIYPKSRFDKIYAQKINKGYTDVTSTRRVPTNVAGFETGNVEIDDLLTRLMTASRQLVSSQYMTSADAVTPDMIAEARGAIRSAMKAKSISGFNNYLELLYSIIPRKMKRVSNHLANSENDFQSILAKEIENIDAMSVQSAVANDGTGHILEMFGLEVSPISKNEEIQIKRLMGKYKHHFVQAIEIEHRERSGRFDTYLTHRAHSDTTTLLWHGSRNENWMSILKTGLVLYPDAQTTGKMLGNGIYFADDFDKSKGYTSARGRWSKEDLGYGVLAIYEVHTGHQYQATSQNNSYSHCKWEYLNTDYLSSNGFDSVAALSTNSSLYRNEFVIYNPDQCRIKYLVECK